MLSASDLAFMIETENLTMSSVVTIFRAGYSESALGNQLETWLVVGDVACDIWPITRNKEERSSGNQELSEGMYYLSVPYNTDLRVIDKVLIGSVTYEVTFVPIGQSWLTNKRCEVRNYNNSITTTALSALLLESGSFMLEG
jgi:hypothetical protein